MYLVFMLLHVFGLHVVACIRFACLLHVFGLHVVACCCMYSVCMFVACMLHCLPLRVNVLLRCLCMGQTRLGAIVR